MNKKERTIEAMKNIAKRYREKDQAGGLFTSLTCALCEIHKNHGGRFGNDCRGCPLADKIGFMGCIDFRSYNEAYESRKFQPIRTIPTYGWLEQYDRKKLLARARFFENYAIPACEDIPEKQFTKRGFKYFNLDLDK